MPSNLKYLVEMVKLTTETCKKGVSSLKMGFIYVMLIRKNVTICAFLTNQAIKLSNIVVTAAINSLSSPLNNTCWISCSDQQQHINTNVHMHHNDGYERWHGLPKVRMYDKHTHTPAHARLHSCPGDLKVNHGWSRHKLKI